MQFTWQSQTRGMRLIVDDQHVKTVSKKLFVLVTDETIENLSFDKKRLSASERQTLIDSKNYFFWLKNLAEKEKLVLELIKDCKPIARRVVESPTGTRLELVYDNNVKVKVPDKVYYSMPKLPVTTAQLNY